jgi:hypothetical protein
MVGLSMQAFWLPKAGNTTEEYEDAFDYAITERRFAVADGATDSAFAGRWARSLVQRFTASPPPLSPQSRCELPKWLESPQRVWREGIDWEHLPWYGMEKAREGAFSSLVGIVFVSSEFPRQSSYTKTFSTEGLRWYALAVGDSCLFHVREDTLLVAFPLHRTEHFSNCPLLLSSNPAHNWRIWEEVRFGEGEGRPYDLFLLATDALAHWFLAQYEAGAKPWTTLCNLKTENHFTSYITHLRQERVIRNDDVTLLTVHLGCYASPSCQLSGAGEKRTEGEEV